MLERWHCSFDELVSKHTQGQIIMLSAGAAIWADIMNEHMENYRKKLEKGDSNTSSTPVARHKVTKKKYQTADEYMAAMDRTGL
jgi:hypothetical protein